MGFDLYPYQKEALAKMKNGCILCGGVGSGKSRTGIAYYFTQEGGQIKPYKRMPFPRDLYIITTARKRDTLEWEDDLAPFLISTDPNVSTYGNTVVVDSWNNIKKYQNVYGAFFIFDEQRVVGKGAWVKAFLRIAARNRWILLSATPGDTWMDYVPVFIANGFYKNRTEFTQRHCVFRRYGNYDKVEKYLEQGRLIRLRNEILVKMDYKRPAQRIDIPVWADFDQVEVKRLIKLRWNFEKDEPIGSASELCYLLRKAVNSDPDRVEAIKDILKEHPKIVVFYNFDYELDILKCTDWGSDVTVSEWNGHKHEWIPETSSWLYLVQYAAGAEGWNCTLTDTMIFYSQNYSYRTMEQAAGRIDRVTTPFEKLYYYHIKSRAGIDLAISKALEEKRNFNERNYTPK